MAVLDYVPWLLAYVFAFGLAIRLLFKSQRNSKNLRMMRFAMLAVLIFSVVRVSISYRFFPDEDGNPLIVFGVFTAAVWCLYWIKSDRVNHVMTLGDREWDYEEFRNRAAVEE